ncbi:hypothetical protein ACS04_03690, partial [Streptomyces roseus]
LPARHEQAVLRHTIERLLESSHGDYEIIVTVGHDDPETAAVAGAAAARAPERVRVVVDHHASKNKPKALNTALPHCRGDIVGVFDAEDQVHPELLAHVDHAFRSAPAGTRAPPGLPGEGLAAAVRPRRAPDPDGDGLVCT